jgi:hypothetical protein
MSRPENAGQGQAEAIKTGSRFGGNGNMDRPLAMSGREMCFTLYNMLYVPFVFPTGRNKIFLDTYFI